MNNINETKKYFCPQCGATILESDVVTTGNEHFCPRCKADTGENVVVLPFKEGKVVENK